MDKKEQVIAEAHENVMRLSKNRISYIDIAKMIAIFAVMFDHSQYYVPQIQISCDFNIFRIWLFSFFLQIFFFVVGVVDKEITTKKVVSWKRYLYKLFVSVLVPYILWSFILTTKYGTSFLGGVLWGTQTSLAEAGVDSILWFFPVFFTAKLLYRIVIRSMYRLRNEKSNLFILAVTIILALCGFTLAGNGQNRVIWGLDIAMIGASLSMLGQLSVPVVEWIRCRAWYTKLLLLLVLLPISVVVSYLNMPFGVSNDGSIVYYSTVWMAHSLFGKSILLFLLSSVVSCIMIMLVAMLLENCNFIAKMGRHTLGFMMLHGKMYPIVASILASISGIATMNGCILALIATCMVSVLCLPVIAFIAKFTPSLEGKTM